jgi:hypothetical protein
MKNCGPQDNNPVGDREVNRIRCFFVRTVTKKRDNWGTQSTEYGDPLWYSLVVNICSLSKISIVAACMVVAAGVVQPAKAYGLQTGTLPVIVNQNTSFHKVKDSGNLPVIIAPNPSDVNGDGGNGCYGGGGNNYTLTIELNSPTTTDQPLVVLSDRPDLVQVPLVVIVPGGSGSVTTNFTVPYSHFTHHKDAHVFASCNGTTVECTIHVHYKGETN